MFFNYEYGLLHRNMLLHFHESITFISNMQIVGVSNNLRFQNVIYVVICQIENFLEKNRIKQKYELIFVLFFALS